MDTQSVLKTYKYRLYPTPEPERLLDTILWRCRALYNVALEARKTAWERRGVSLNYYHQANELPDLKAACPEYGEVHSQVLQDVLRRLEKTYQNFFRRVQRGEKAGFPRFVRHSKLSVAMSGGWNPILSGESVPLSPRNRVFHSGHARSRKATGGMQTTHAPLSASLTLDMGKGKLSQGQRK
jgi:transposase